MKCFNISKRNISQCIS